MVRGSAIFAYQITPFTEILETKPSPSNADFFTTHLTMVDLPIALIYFQHTAMRHYSFCQSTSWVAPMPTKDTLNTAHLYHAGHPHFPHTKKNTSGIYG